MFSSGRPSGDMITMMIINMQQAVQKTHVEFFLYNDVLTLTCSDDGAGTWTL